MSWTLTLTGLFQHTYVDQSPLVARRLGFSSLPLAVLAILIFYQSLSLLFSLPSATSGSFSPAGIWDTESPVTRGFFDFTNEELLRCATWIFLGVLIWLWLIPSLSFPIHARMLTCEIQFCRDQDYHWCEPHQLCYAKTRWDGGSGGGRRSE